MTTRTCTATATPRPRAIAWRPAPTALREVLTFAVIGVISTLTYVALYAVLREAMPAPAANGAALLVTAIGNTAANRRLTFRVRGRQRLARDHAAGLLALSIALAVTSASLALLGWIAPGAGRDVELLTLVAANGLATLVRFLLLRRALARGPVAPRRSPSAAVIPPSRLEGNFR